MNSDNSSKKRTVFAAVCGRTNAGKSSLVNRLIGEKVAIVSNKPQTTRTRINGILTDSVNAVQYVFIDTPGFHKEKSGLSRHMLGTIRSCVTGADVILLLSDCTKKPFVDRSISEQSADVILLLNKVDLVKDKALLLETIAAYSKMHDFAEIIPVSVRNGDNVDKILPLLSSYAKEGDEFYFDENLPTDQPEKIWLSEIIREKLLRELREELPHGIAVQIEEMEFTKTTGGKPIVNLSAVIICEKASHKGMVIGKGGGTLKKIGGEARLECEEYFESKVNLKLWVKVAEDWRNRENLIHEFGLRGET